MLVGVFHIKSQAWYLKVVPLTDLVKMSVKLSLPSILCGSIILAATHSLTLWKEIAVCFFCNVASGIDAFWMTPRLSPNNLAGAFTGLFKGSVRELFLPLIQLMAVACDLQLGLQSSDHPIQLQVTPVMVKLCIHLITNVSASLSPLDPVSFMYS